MINSLVNELYVPEWLSIDIRLLVTPRRIVADSLSPEFRTQNLGKIETINIATKTKILFFLLFL